MTSISPEEQAAIWDAYCGEYRRIRGSEYEKPTRPAIYLERIPAVAARWIKS